MNSAIAQQQKSSRGYSRLKVAGVLLTLGGIALFAYFVYKTGFYEIRDGVVHFGFAGFAVILFLYFLRICVRSYAWKLSVYENNGLRLRDAIPAVIIGEALSSMLPLGILISGTSKAIAVRKRIPMVVAMSSVATENLFFTVITGVFLVLGGVVALHVFNLDESLVVTINFMIAVVAALAVFGFAAVIREWHIASEFCEWVYEKGFFQRLLEKGRLDVRLFENLLYGFYRRYPQRFLPICLLESAYHVIGIVEVWYILSRLTDSYPSLITAFLLESVSRMIIVLFKLIPFVIGVDEAGAQFVANTVALAAGVGLTLAIIRKGRILFWSALGLILIVKRGLSIREISHTELKSFAGAE